MTNNHKVNNHKIRLTQEKHEKIIKDKRELEIWSNFIETINSEESKYGYTNLLWVYMEFEKATNYSQLLDRPIENIKTSIKNYLLSLKNHSLSTSYIRYNKAAVKHFYDMNDIANLGWKKLNKFMGEETEMHEDRAYTHEEIARVYDVAHKRLRVCVYLEKSAGLRVGALHTIKYKHLTKKEDCYKIDVYKGTSGNGKYFTFCDREAAKAIEDYLNFRRQCGEIIDDNSPLLRSEFNTNQNKPNHHYNTNVESITRHAVRREMNNYLVQAGLRTVDHENTNNRKEVKATHGFRKFFESQLILAGIHETLIKRLMGHSAKGLDRRYERLTEDQLFEIYKTAIPYLMIDQTAKLVKKVKEQEKELTKVELIQVDYDQKIKLLLEKNKGDKKAMEERLDKIQQENKEREERLISLIAKESIVGKPAVPPSQIDLGQLDAIPLSISNRQGEDTKDFVIHNDIESIKNNPIKINLSKNKLKSKSKLYNLEDPPNAFLQSQSKMKRRKVN